MMYVLDTNMVSEIRKVSLGTSDPNVAQWADNVSANSLYLSVITILEIELGVFQIERKDPRQGLVLRKWLEASVLPEFEGRNSLWIRSSLGAVRVSMSQIREGRHDCGDGTGSCRNTSDFQLTGVLLLNPWDFSG